MKKTTLQLREQLKLLKDEQIYWDGAYRTLVEGDSTESLYVIEHIFKQRREILNEIHDVERELG
jgi:hypothetical protein